MENRRRNNNKPSRNSSERSGRPERPSGFNNRNSRSRTDDDYERPEHSSKFSLDKPERSARPERPSGFASDRPERSGRPERPSKYASDRPERSGRPERPSKFASDRPERSGRPERPSKFASDRPERSGRPERPSKFASDRPERSGRPERPSKFASDRPERQSVFSSDRPERSGRPERPSKYASNRPERSGRPERPSKFASDRPERPSRFDDRNNRNRTEHGKSGFERTERDYEKTERGGRFDYDKGDAPELVYGKNAVVEILKGNLSVNKIWICETARNTHEVIEHAKEKNVPIKTVNKSKITSLVSDEVNHQGIVAEIAKKEYMELDELLDACKDKEAFFIILDGVEDPHNLGAIIRTADAAGVDGIIIPKHGAVGATSTVYKVSAGALERMNICRVTNLSQAIETLKKNNIWIAGVDMVAKEVYSESTLKGPIALVLGGEGKGLSLKLKDNCDFTIKIPMNSKANSLNVSVSAAITIYEIYKQRGFKS